MNRIKNYLNKKALGYDEDAELPWSFSTATLIAAILGLIFMGMLLAVRVS